MKTPYQKSVATTSKSPCASPDDPSPTTTSENTTCSRRPCNKAEDLEVDSDSPVSNRAATVRPPEAPPAAVLRKRAEMFTRRKMRICTVKHMMLQQECLENSPSLC